MSSSKAIITYAITSSIQTPLISPALPVTTEEIVDAAVGAAEAGAAIVHRADRLFGDNYRWSALGAERSQMLVAATAAAMGGNARVGLEDSLWVGNGRPAASNAERVTQMRRLVEGLGLEAASPDEARKILALKGADQVGL